jgi:prepilin-type N-terminal cleavage/methylation domain-containing protein
MSQTIWKIFRCFVKLFCPKKQLTGTEFAGECGAENYEFHENSIKKTKFGVKKKLSGFTMLEIMVCITLVAVLTGYFAFLNRPTEARRVRKETVNFARFREMLLRAVLIGRETSLHSPSGAHLSVDDSCENFLITYEDERGGKRRWYIPIKNTITFNELKFSYVDIDSEDDWTSNAKGTKGTKGIKGGKGGKGAKKPKYNHVSVLRPPSEDQADVTFRGGYFPKFRLELEGAKLSSDSDATSVVVCVDELSQIKRLK